MWLFLVAALAICAVVAIGAALNSGPHPQHARPRHLAAVPDPPEWGSMILAEEREFLTTIPGTRMTIYTDGSLEFSEEPDWREQTMAELSPEALDPGAGDEVSSEPPAPAPDPDGRPGDLSQSDPPPVRADWLEAQMAATFTWSREVRVRLAAI